MFKFYLDNIEVSNPINWEEFTETIEYDATIKGVLPKYELKLNFVGGGYEYLYSKRVEIGFCQLVELRVDFACSDGTFKPLLEGYINIARCKFNLNKCFVECDVLDNNYGALIYNNKNIKANLGADTSKTGVIIPKAIVNKIKFFDPDTGIYPSNINARECVTIYEAFKFLIAFMTDGKVAFDSVLFSSLYNGTNFYILTGKSIRNNTGGLPEISFEELFVEVYKKFNIAFTIKTINGMPTMIIDPIDFIYSSASGIELENIEDFKESFNPEKLYSNVILGGTTTDYDNTIHSFFPRQFFSFNEESYYFQNQCNLDKTLDLKGDWIVDSNIIQEVAYIFNLDTTYDSDIFFVEGYETTFPYVNAQIYFNVIYSSNSRYYNKQFLNVDVSGRFDIYGDSTLATGTDTEGFRATREGNPEGNFGYNVAPYSPPNTQFAHIGWTPTNLNNPYFITRLGNIIFSNDYNNGNYNHGNNFNILDYTVPIDGGYYFEVRAMFRQGSFVGGLKLNLTNSDLFLSSVINPVRSRYTIEIERKNSGGTIQEVVEQSFPNTSGLTKYDFQSLPDGTYVYQVSAYLICEAGDKIRPYFSVESYRDYQSYFPQSFTISQTYPFPDVNYQDFYVNVTNGSYWRCIATPSSGGVFQTGDMTNYKIAKIEFEQPLSNEDYTTLKSDLTKSIQVNHDGQTNKVGWIRKSTRKLASGETSWELISDLKNT